MGDWDFHLVDYWDQRTGAINRNVLRLARLGEPERAAACDQVRDAVDRRAQALEDGHLLQAAVTLVDDLYKYVNDEVMMHPALFEYLAAFGRPFTRTVRERGYVIRYVVDNQFSGTEFLMLGPFDVFPKVFNAAGFFYICPQHLAQRLMQPDGVAASGYESALPRYIAEARAVGDQILGKCHEDGMHYVFLEADYQDGALDLALRGRGDPGVLSIFRSDAPVPGTEVSISFPERTLEG